MNNINDKNIDLSILSQIDSKLLSDVRNKNKKYALIQSSNGKLIKWLSPEEINNEKSKNRLITTNIITISQLIKDGDASKFNYNESINILNNIKFIDSKLEQYKKNDDNSIIRSLYNKFSSGKEAIKYKTDESFVANLEKQKYNLDSLQLVENSFFEENKTINEKNLPLLLRLIKANHDKTFDDLQRNPAYRKLVIDYLDQYPEEIAKDPSLTYLKAALKSLERHDLKFQHERDFLKTLLFIEKYRYLMLSGEIGKDSKKQKGLKKIRVDFLTHEITYDSKTGDALRLNSQVQETGNYKTVKKSIDLVSSQLLAIQKQGKLRGFVNAMATSESAIWKECQGIPNVPPLLEMTRYDSRKRGNTQTMATHFYNLGSLNQNKNRLSRKQKLQVLRDVAIGLKAMHKKNIAHRDIKPANIVINEFNNELKAGIIDFGLACRINLHPLSVDKGRFVIAGSPGYMPPEAMNYSEIDRNPTTEKHDIFSLGVTIMECLPDEFNKQGNEFQIEVYKMIHPDKNQRSKNLDNIINLLETEIEKQNE